MPELTVIIPTYKPQAYLWKCLASIHSQTLPKHRFEVLLVLNGCDAPYRQDIEAYLAWNMAGTDIHLIQTDEAGVSNARNLGLDRARGGYITFVDDDDYVSPSYLEELLCRAAKGTVVFSDVLSFEDGSDVMCERYFMHQCYLRNAGKTSRTLFGMRALLNGPCGKVFDRDIIGTRRFSPKFRNGEDCLLMLEVSDRIGHVRLTSGAAVYYRRIRENSAVTAHRSLAVKLRHSFRLMSAFTRVIVHAPLRYNYPFVLSRYAAVLKDAIFGQ